MESAEHAWIGDQLSLQFPSATRSAKDLPLALPLPGLPAGSTLTYGQVVALGGDFYGVVGTPISTAPDPRAAFWAAFQTLGGDWAQTRQILAIMAEEIQAVEAALAAGKSPSTAYAALGDSLSLRWNVVTGGENLGDLPVRMGRYLLLAAENWDHFTQYAVTAYTAGHALAMERAAAIGHALPPEETDIRLQEAYAINAFADHFLTDLFSAGHLRVPRKELYDQVATPIPNMTGTLGSLLARCMHDEDSRYGLRVADASGGPWQAYGDKRLLDSVSGDNRAMVVKAAQASAGDVWNAYLGQPQEYTALSYVPNLARVADVGSRENFSPLFRSLAGAAERRTDVANRNDYTWTADWWGWSTWAAITAAGSHDYVHVKCYSQVDGRFLGWLGVGYNNYAVVVTDEKDAQGMVWYADGQDLYLQKDTSPFSRYLGEGYSSYADWGLWAGNFKSPVIYHDDMTVSLKDAPHRKLYLYTDNQLCWSNGESGLDVVRIDLPVDGPYPTM